MRLHVLGPLALIGDSGQQVPLTPQDARLLTVLALSPQRRCSNDLLVAALRGPRPAGEPVNALRKSVCVLRKLLRRHGLPDSLVETVHGYGYRLRLPPGACDLDAFRLGVAAAASAAADGDLAGAIQLLRDALDGWPEAADVFPDLPDIPELQAVPARLAEERRQALKELAGLLIRAGRYAEVIGPLRVHAAADPWCEWIWLTLMRALSLAGRHNEVVSAYHRARQALAENCGTSPGHEMRELFEESLRAVA
jgi:SARP family transcriptional regulator, regulator of embCAB operon